MNGFPPRTFASCSFFYSCRSENGYPLAYIAYRELGTEPDTKTAKKRGILLFLYHDYTLYSIQSWKAETTFHYCKEIKSGFKLVWKEFTFPCDSSLKWHFCSLVWPKTLKHNPVLTTGQPFSYRFASQAAASEWQKCVGRTHWKIWLIEGNTKCCKKIYL